MNCSLPRVAMVCALACHLSIFPAIQPYPLKVVAGSRNHWSLIRTSIHVSNRPQSTGVADDISGSGRSGSIPRLESSRGVTHLQKGGEIHGADYGMKGDGATDNTSAFALAVRAASLVHSTVTLKAGTYLFSVPVTSGIKGAHIRGISPESTIIKRVSGGTERILLKDAFDGWTFENLTLDGNTFNIPQPHGQSINLRYTHNITFRNVTFRNMSTLFTINVSALRFEGCRFYGTRPGAMEGGTRTPTPVSGINYSAGFNLNTNTNDVVFENCYFHFLSSGINTYAADGERSKGLRVVNSTFRSDWWNQPYVAARFKATGWTRGGYLGGGNLNVPAGAVPAGVDVENPFALTVEIATGASWTAGRKGSATVINLPKTLRGIKLGDSFETLDGKRAEVLAIVSPTVLQLSDWESIDTFEPATPPALSARWVINRYYAAFPYPKQPRTDHDTSIQMYGEFYNPFDGERFNSTGLSYAGREVRVFAKKIYSGIHIQHNNEDVQIEGNHFRGSWADQLSIFYSKGVRVIGNRFEYGGDEGITAISCDGALITDNRFLGQGASAIFSSSDNGRIIGNSIENWGGVNGFVGAYDFAGRASVLSKNSAYTAPNSGYLASIGIRITGFSDGALIADNIENGRNYSVKVENGSGRKIGHVTIRNTRGISKSGDGAFTYDSGVPKGR